MSVSQLLSEQAPGWSFLNVISLNADQLFTTQVVSTSIETATQAPIVSNSGFSLAKTVLSVAAPLNTFNIVRTAGSMSITNLTINPAASQLYEVIYPDYTASSNILFTIETSDPAQLYGTVFSRNVNGWTIRIINNSGVAFGPSSTLTLEYLIV